MLRPRVGLGTASAEMYDVFKLSRSAAQKAENDEDTTAPKAAAKVDSDIYQYHSDRDKDDFFVHVAPVVKRKPRRQRKKNDLGGFIVRKRLALYIVSPHDFDHPCTSMYSCTEVFSNNTVYRQVHVYLGDS